MSQFNPALHHRRSIRIKEYDFSQAGSYFITACTKNRECILGTATDDGVELSALGDIVSRQWASLPNRFPNVALDAFVVMRNHIHGIIVLAASVGATLAVAQNRAGASPAPTERPLPRLGQVVGTFKSLSVRQWLHYIRLNHLDLIGKFWQRNYYEHTIRDDTDLNRIRSYIATNSFCWNADIENPRVSNGTNPCAKDEKIWFSKCMDEN